ncbi:MAG: ATP-binding protein [Candidatus Bilamarchaeaceae archaeon]
MIMFINRAEELGRLLELARSKRAELALIYGRRRVGKSRLLVEFAKKTDALYLLADISENILDVLSKQVMEEFVKFNTWDDFFEFLYKSRHKIIIIDEFQYLYQVNRAWPTIAQRWWEKLKGTDKKLILCGSIISAIYKIAMGYGSALYGRKTMEMHILPLKFKFIKDFFPDYKIEQLVEAYSILGGVPRYLEEFDPKLSIDENIKKKILDKTSFLYNEPLNLLFEEFRTPAPYTSILSAIADGYIKFVEIAEVSKIQSYKLPKYLSVLERVGLIEKEIPVIARKLKAKTTRYKIKDNFYSFWFKFIFKNKSAIEQGLQKEVFGSIKQELNAYVGKAFENICKEFILEAKIFKPTKIGKWWHKDKEIDIVALNERNKEILFAECKWQNRVDARTILAELKEKAALVQWKSEKQIYAIFAKSFKEKFKEPDVLLFDSKDLERML